MFFLLFSAIRFPTNMCKHLVLVVVGGGFVYCFPSSIPFSVVLKQNQWAIVFSLDSIWFLCQKMQPFQALSKAHSHLLCRMKQHIISIYGHEHRTNNLSLSRSPFSITTAMENLLPVAFLITLSLASHCKVLTRKRNSFSRLEMRHTHTKKTDRKIAFRSLFTLFHCLEPIHASHILTCTHAS